MASHGPSAPRVASQYLCPTWRRILRLHDVVLRSLSTQRAVARFHCTMHDDVASRGPFALHLIGDWATSRSLQDVEWHHFLRRNSSPNISDQLICFHVVEGGTGRSIADRPTKPIRVIAGTDHWRTIGRNFSDYSVFLDTLGLFRYFCNHSRFWNSFSGLASETLNGTPTTLSYQHSVVHRHRLFANGKFP